MIQNLQHVVELARQQHPQAWKDAHTGNARTEDFVRLVAPMMAAVDARFGLNGKRGDPNDISDDAVNVRGEGPGHNNDGTPCTVIDFIGGAGGPNPQVQWGVQDDPVASTGEWVNPGTAQTPPQPPTPPAPVFPYPDEGTAVLAFQNRVKKAYKDVQRIFPDPNDSDAYRHFTRFGYSCSKMAEPDAANKHISELRAQLGAGPE